MKATTAIALPPPRSLLACDASIEPPCLVAAGHANIKTRQLYSRSGDRRKSPRSSGCRC